MKTIVCVKQVPASNEVRLDPKTNTIIRDGGQAVINPFDSHALEAALQLKECCGGTVTVLISRQELHTLQSERFVAETFDGSLPAFLAAFTARKKLKPEEVAQLRRMVAEYEEV